MPFPSHAIVKCPSYWIICIFFSEVKDGTWQIEGPFGAIWELRYGLWPFAAGTSANKKACCADCTIVVFRWGQNFWTSKELFQTTKYIYVILRRRFIPNKINKNSCGTGSVHPASVDPSKYVNGATAGPLLPRGSFLSILGQLPTPTLSMFEH